MFFWLSLYLGNDLIISATFIILFCNVFLYWKGMLDFVNTL